MKNFVNLVLIAVFFFGIYATSANAQMMGGFSNSTTDWEEVVEHTAREEQEGKVIWNKLQAKEVVCENLSDEQFGVLGEYFMGQMAGDSHAAMNVMMIQTHGEDGEDQIHIVMGKNQNKPGRISRVCLCAPEVKGTSLTMSQGDSPDLLGAILF